MTHQAGPARAFTQSRPLSQTHHAMVAPRPSLHVPPFTPTVKVAGARFPTVHTQRATSRGAGPLTLSRTHEDHAPLQHMPSPPADGTGPRVSLPDWNPEAPVNRSYKSSGSSRQVQRRTSLDCSNLAVRPSARAIARCGRREGHLVPYAALPYASPRLPPGLRTYHADRPAPRYRTAVVGGGPGRVWCTTNATGAARATSCSTLPRWQSTPPRMPAQAARGPHRLPAPPRIKRLEPSPRCFDHIHNHLDNPARNTHSPVNARVDSGWGGRQWQGRFGIHQSYCLRY